MLDSSSDDRPFNWFFLFALIAGIVGIAFFEADARFTVGLCGLSSLLLLLGFRRQIAITSSTDPLLPPPDSPPRPKHLGTGEYVITLLEAGSQKIMVIKRLRELTGLGLREAKDKVEMTPAILFEGLGRPTAEYMAAQLEVVGAKVEIRGRYGPLAGETSRNPPKAASSVILLATGSNKIGVIKVIRSLTPLGLKEAKDLADHPPAPILEGVDQATAEIARQMLEAEGAMVEIR
jgi:large subunit ribosomal protein L7/L12